MKIKTINTGFFKLDGGAMFGVVPKRMWEKLNPPDAHNLCTWAMRCLLIETEDRRILIDTGIGDKQDEKFRSHFEPFRDDTLLKSLEKKGLSPEDITDVFFTHLHFDHSGGAVSQDEKGNLYPTFPNAQYWTNKAHWDWAMNPNPREAASFLKENFEILKDNNRLQFIDNQQGISFLPHIEIYFTNGHTEAMMSLKIQTDDKTLFYCADTIPSSWHISMPYIMAYDIRPLETLKEKAAILEQAATEGWYLFFEHDPVTECCTVVKDASGRIKVHEKFNLSEIF